MKTLNKIMCWFGIHQWSEWKEHVCLADLEARFCEREHCTMAQGHNWRRDKKPYNCDSLLKSDYR